MKCLDRNLTIYVQGLYDEDYRTLVLDNQCKDNSWLGRLMSPSVCSVVLVPQSKPSHLVHGSQQTHSEIEEERQKI